MTQLEPLYRRGDRLELIFMSDDPCPIEPGTKGTVVADSRWIGDCWQTMMSWDNGRTLAIVSPLDKVRLI